jgi:lipoprotein-releasing system permease protein
MLSLVGMALGVACLTVAMAVVSGYEVTLKTAIIDVFGHIQLVHRGENSQNLEVVISQIKEIAPEVETYTPFVKVEGLVVGGGKLSGIIIQGIDAKTVEKVLHIRDRVIKGEFSFEPRNGLPSALVGKASSRRLQKVIQLTLHLKCRATCSAGFLISAKPNMTSVRF